MSSGLSNTDAPPLGQFFMLAMSDAEIDALAAPVRKKTTACTGRGCAPSTRASCAAPAEASSQSSTLRS